MKEINRAMKGINRAIKDINRAIKDINRAIKEINRLTALERTDPGGMTSPCTDTKQTKK